jgi:hypothetical protein
MQRKCPFPITLLAYCLKGAALEMRRKMSITEAGNGGETHSVTMVTLSMPPKRSFDCLLMNVDEKEKKELSSAVQIFESEFLASR